MTTPERSNVVATLLSRGHDSATLTERYAAAVRHPLVKVILRTCIGRGHDRMVQG